MQQYIADLLHITDTALHRYSRAVSSELVDSSCDVFWANVLLLLLLLLMTCCVSAVNCSSTVSLSSLSHTAVSSLFQLFLV